MLISQFDIDVTPKIKESLDTDESAVTVTCYLRGTDTVVPLVSDVCTQVPAGSGRWLWEVNMVTLPTTGQNQYGYKMVGSTYGQAIWGAFDWNENTDRYKGIIYLDVTGGGIPLSADLPYTGTIYRPVDNLADALIIAARIGTLEIWVKGNVTLDRSVAGYKFNAVRGVLNDSITLANQNTNLCTFSNMKITGAWNGDSVYCDTCVLQGTTNFNGYGKLTIFMDSISIKNGGSLQGDNCRFVSYTYGTCTIDFQNSATNFMAVSLAAGLVTLVNIAGATCYISGDVVKTLTTSIVAGQLVFSGTGHRSGAAGLPFVQLDECMWAGFAGPTPVLILIDYTNPSSVANLLTANYQDAGTLMKALTDTLADALAIFNKLPTNYIMGSSVLTAKDGAIDGIGTGITDIKGTGFVKDVDSLKNLSHGGSGLKVNKTLQMRLNLRLGLELRPAVLFIILLQICQQAYGRRERGL